MPSVEDQVYIPPQQVGSVAIIGGGASGAIAADALLKDGVSKVTLFERRQELGGVWVLDEKSIEFPNEILVSGKTSLETDPQLENPFHTSVGCKKITLGKNTQERFLHTPSYKGLTTNIIEKLMTYSDQKRWLPEGESKYVDGLVVRNYIDKYIKRNTENGLELVTGATVEDVERINREGIVTHLPYKFRLTIRESAENHDLWYQREFDAVVVATGHYHIPHVTYVPGLPEIQQKFPKVLQHAKFFRDAALYEDKTVIVVGSRASGADLSKLIARAGGKVYQSIRSVGKRFNSHPEIIHKPSISRYEAKGDSFEVVFEDGTTLKDPDHIIYGTGYDWSYPFLNRLTNSTITDGAIVQDLYQHTFYTNDPLINFVGVPVDGISFRVFEYQAILVSRFITGKIKIPSPAHQREWQKKRLEEKGRTRAYHTIGYADALDYVESLVDLGGVADHVTVGRRFPPLTREDLEEYREAGENLVRFWNEI